jgi:adenylate cyclase, class 2
VTLEIEQKFRVANRAALREKLIAAGASFEAAVAQSDTYFAHPSRDFASTDEAFRIRSVGDSNFVTYKGPKQQHAVKTRREIELPLAGGNESAAQWAELLALLGFRAVETVRKRREEGHIDWQDRDVNVALDAVDGLGEFCEIELCVEGSETAAAQELIQTLAVELGLADIEPRSYLSLVLAKTVE